MICTSCGTDNVAGAKFCSECATPLASACPNCGATNKPGAKFCNECGAAVGPAMSAVGAQPRTAPTPEPAAAERRLVTILFADLVGFTPYAEERDAEDVRDTLSGYFKLCAQIIERYGGTVEKYIGDAVMAVWGAPLAHEDDAERAVRAALDLVDGVPALATGVAARVGVLTGEAAVTLGATNQGMVAGDLVNTASRLQSVAQSGTVLVGEATMRASSGAVVYEPSGDQALKGKQVPIPAWRALRVVAERGGRNRSEALEAPFVGRVDELRLLKDLFHATGREQKARLVSVIGTAGVGKSRMAWEFLKYVDGLVETMYWHDGRSPAYGEGISFWALGEMVRGRVGLLEDDDEPTTRRKIAESVAQWVTDDDERRWIEGALLALLGVESGVPADQLFAAWRTFFDRISEQGTVVLVFEDLHFADPGLLDFIDHLLDWSRARPIYVVTLARPDLLERRPDWGAGKRSFTSVYLEPLTEPQMHELLSGLVPGLPKEAAQAIVARADGIPLYAVETVRMLVADGRLTQRDGSYAPSGDLGSLAVPETLTALIRSRLDSLNSYDGGLINDAAVLGQSFSLASLAAISGRSEPELQPHLMQLVKHELLVFQADPRSPERGQYGFVQALIREVAYNTLSKRDRKARHVAAARYYEQQESDELASVLAGHYLAAHENAGSGPEANALRAQARVALKGAAERAANLGSFAQATHLLEQAAAITSDERDLAELHEQAGQAASHAARYDVAQDHYRSAIDLYKGVGDRLATARVWGFYGESMLEARRNKVALPLLEAAAVEFADITEPQVAARLRMSLSRALGQNEQFERALSVADEGLDIAEHAGLLRLVVSGLILSSIALGNQGRIRQAVALLTGAADLARTQGFDEDLAGALIVFSARVIEIEPWSALQTALEAADLARRLGRRDRLMIAVTNVSYTGFQVGEWDQAINMSDALLEEDLDPAGRLWLLSNNVILHAARGDDVRSGLAELDALVAAANEPELTGASMDSHANVALAAGDLKGAAAAWRATVPSSGELVGWAHYQAGRCELWLGDIEAARKDLERIETSGFQGPAIDARLMTLRAGMAALEGRSAEAAAQYERAIAAWHAIRLRWDEALTGMDMVTLLDPTDPRVQRVADQTRQMLVELRARPYLERLDEILARPRQVALKPVGKRAGASPIAETAG